MKKAKIMLFSVAVLAIVGGALAFKAKTFGFRYCYTTQTTTNKNSTPIACTLETIISKEDPLATNKFFYAKFVDEGVPCPATCPPLSLINE